MSEWWGLIFLIGSVAGYTIFMISQPYRATVGEGFGVAWHFPFLWFVTGVFESVRLTLDISVELATDGISPDDFLRVDPLTPLPNLVELLAPAGDAAMDSFLRLATFIVEAWPLSVVLALCLLGNAGGALGHLWVAPRGGRRPARRLFTALAAAAAVFHLAETATRWLPSKWTPELTPLRAEVLRLGSDLFTVGCGVAVQVWLVLWVTCSGARKFDGAVFPAAMGRLVSLTVVILAYLGLRGLHHHYGDLNYGRFLTAGGIVVAFLMLPAQLRVMEGECGLITGLARHGVWIFSHAERVFWWLAVAGIHLFLLHLLGAGTGILIGELHWAMWVWGVFFSFLKTGIYVWLLSAFILLLQEEASPR